MTEDCDVFISYAHQDISRAKALTKELRKHGISVWSDERIAPGEDWISALEQALLRSRNYLFLVSRSAQDAPWVKREYAAAIL